MDLIRGGSLENAIVLTRDGIMNGELRYPDEFGRHKTLDLIGDLALIGRPLLARVVAHKAGHALHTQLVSRLLADPSLWTETTSSRNSRAEEPVAEYSAAGMPGRLLRLRAIASGRRQSCGGCTIRRLPSALCSSALLSKASERGGQYRKHAAS